MSEICSWNLLKAMWRLVDESGPSNTAKTQLFFMELGFSVFTICIEALNDVPPLSPPSLTHTSVGGIRPLCHVNCPNLR